MIQTQVCPECGENLLGDAPQGLCPKCLIKGALSRSTPPPQGTSPYFGPFIPPTPSELGKHFPQLEILELLGQGGMGAVYKARQPKLDRMVALKILPPEWGRDPAFAERFQREAKALARLSHPNIVAVHDFGEAGGLFYFLMEYVDGANLRQLMHGAKIESPLALRIAAQVCDALQYAHEESVVHRDVKPENILMDQKGRVKIADFGLAKLVGYTPGFYTLTGSRQIMGTPHYMAPEQMEKPHTVDQRADIYSLGVVLYEMLTGELPLGHFAAVSQKAKLDQRLDPIIYKSLAREPERRYQRISEVKNAVEQVARAEWAAPPSPQHRPPLMAQPVHGADAALARVTRLLESAANSLFTTGLLTIVLWPVLMIMLCVAWPRDADDIFIGFMMSWPIFYGIGILHIFGARQFRTLRSYGLAVTSCILAIIPCSLAWPLAFPVGLMSFGLLRRRDVRAAFDFVRFNNVSLAAPPDWQPPPPAVVPVLPVANPATPVPEQPQGHGFFRSAVRNVRNLFVDSQMNEPEPTSPPVTPPPAVAALPAFVQGPYVVPPVANYAPPPVPASQAEPQSFFGWIGQLFSSGAAFGAICCFGGILFTFLPWAFVNITMKQSYQRSDFGYWPTYDYLSGIEIGTGAISAGLFTLIAFFLIATSPVQRLWPSLLAGLATIPTIIAAASTFGFRGYHNFSNWVYIGLTRYDLPVRATDQQSVHVGVGLGVYWSLVASVLLMFVLAFRIRGILSRRA